MWKWQFFLAYFVEEKEFVVLENTTKQHLLLSGVKENATNGGLLVFELVKGDTSDEWLVCQIPVQWM